MTRFAAPTADPHGLRSAARRLSATAADLDTRGTSVSAAGGAVAGAWTGSASLLFVARTRELRSSTAQAADALVQVSRVTERYADQVEEARDQVRRMNRQWDDAVDTARRQAAAAAEQARRDAEAARATGERLVRRAYDDGSERLRRTEAELQRQYETVTGSLTDAGWSLERALLERDPIALLPPWVAGGAIAVQAGGKGFGLLTRGVAGARYTSLLVQTARWFRVGDPRVARALLGADEAVAFRNALSGAGRTGRLAGVKTVVGRAFLPLTLVSGAVDVRTGGGHTGVRGGATRVLGGAGAAGALALLAPGIALGPVGLAVAGGAVLAYGAYSLGSLVYDNRQAIGAFAGRVGSSLSNAASTATAAAGRAATNAAGAVASGTRALATGAVDTGRKVLDVVTSPARLIPSFGGVF